jgi:Protein of unknown function (DUF5663)
MIELNADRLTALGYRGLTREQVNTLLQEMYKAGEEIVGLKLSERMSEEEIDAFNKFFDEGKDDEAFDWLKTNCPDYREIAEVTFEELDATLRDAATQIRSDVGISEPGDHQVEG